MFLSVIIPVYNVSRFIERGMKSLMSQSFQDFEVIMVDDGSTDGSSEMCDRMAAEDSRIMVIHKVNEGSGPARNAGIEVAEGEYITFFDVDDILKPGALGRIHAELSASPVDLLVYGYDEYYPDSKVSHAYEFPSVSCRNNMEVRDIYVETLSGLKFNNGFVWNKVYRRDLLLWNHLRFEPLRIQQDEVFNLTVYPHVNTLRCIPGTLYTYFIYNTGNTRSHFIPDRLDIYRRVRDAFLTLGSHWRMDSPELASFIYRKFLDAVLYHIDYNVFHPANPSTLSVKEQIFSVMASQDVRDAVSQLKHLDAIPVGFPKKQYYAAFLRKSPEEFLSIRRWSRVFDTAKRMIKRCIPR